MDVTGVFVCHDSSISGVRQEATEKNTPSVWGRIVRVIAPIMAIGGAVAACLVSGGLFIGLSAAVAVVGGVASIYLLYKSISDRHVSTEPKSYPQANAGSAATTTTRTGPVLSTAADSALSVASKPFVMQAQRAPDPGSVSFSFPGVPSITTPVPDNPRAISSPLVMPWFLPAQDYVGIPYSGSARDTPFVAEYTQDPLGVTAKNLPGTPMPAFIKTGEKDSTPADSSSETETSFAPALCKNEFKNEHQPFTKVQMTNGNWVELLNTLPEEVANQLLPARSNFSTNATGRISRNKMSDAAIRSLRIEPNDVTDKSKSCYFGAGEYGKVKFARLVNTGEIIAAKKMRHLQYDYAETVEKEVRIQKQAGSSTLKIHGVAHRKNSKGENQSIIFMEIAAGSCPDREELHKFGKHRPELALSLLKKVNTAVKNRSFHLDLRWENVVLNSGDVKSDQCNLKLLDFGMAETSEQIEPTYCSISNPMLPVRVAPELVVQRENISSEKVVVWEVGLMILDLFTKNKQTRHVFNDKDLKWHPPGNDETNQTIYNDCVLQAFSTTDPNGFQTEFQRYLPVVQNMLSYKPEDRMGIQKAIETFERLIEGDRNSRQKYA